MAKDSDAEIRPEMLVTVSSIWQRISDAETSAKRLVTVSSIYGKGFLTQKSDPKGLSP